MQEAQDEIEEAAIAQIRAKSKTLATELAPRLGQAWVDEVSEQDIAQANAGKRRIDNGGECRRKLLHSRNMGRDDTSRPI